MGRYDGLTVAEARETAKKAAGPYNKASCILALFCAGAFAAWLKVSWDARSALEPLEVAVKRKLIMPELLDYIQAEMNIATMFGVVTMCLLGMYVLLFISDCRKRQELDRLAAEKEKGRTEAGEPDGKADGNDRGDMDDHHTGRRRDGHRSDGDGGDRDRNGLRRIHGAEGCGSDSGGGAEDGCRVVRDGGGRMAPLGCLGDLLQDEKRMKPRRGIPRRLKCPGSLGSPC